MTSVPRALRPNRSQAWIGALTPTKTWYLVGQLPREMEEVRTPMLGAVVTVRRSYMCAGVHSSSPVAGG